jgi:predicted nuclease with TOPRIM domain
VDPADEKAALEDELGALEAQMKEVRDRLDRIEKES